MEKLNIKSEANLDATCEEKSCHRSTVADNFGITTNISLPSPAKQGGLIVEKIN